MKPSADLAKAKILIADPDFEIARVTQNMLGAMGFTSVFCVKNGLHAFELIRSREVDILITEWSVPGLDGISLIKSLRQEYSSPNILLPIIMLTARSERINVEMARDCGVTEFVVKPFTSATLYERIRNIFDNPKDFIFSSSYNGPDRRHQQPISKERDRRIVQPTIISGVALSAIDLSSPKRVRNNKLLHRKIGLNDRISLLITDEVLREAQKAIQSFSTEAERWIAEDIRQLDAEMDALKRNHIKTRDSHRDEMIRLLLAIRSRAGTFEHSLAASIAYSLYLFIDKDFMYDNINHIVILQKHIDVLKVLLAGNFEAEMDFQNELVQELNRLTDKLRVAPA